MTRGAADEHCKAIVFAISRHISCYRRIFTQFFVAPHPCIFVVVDGRDFLSSWGCNYTEIFALKFLKKLSNIWTTYCIMSVKVPTDIIAQLPAGGYFEKDIIFSYSESLMWIWIHMSFFSFITIHFHCFDKIDLLILQMFTRSDVGTLWCQVCRIFVRLKAPCIQTARLNEAVELIYSLDNGFSENKNGQTEPIFDLPTSVPGTGIFLPWS